MGVVIVFELFCVCVRECCDVYDVIDDYVCCFVCDCVLIFFKCRDVERRSSVVDAVAKRRESGEYVFVC